MSIRIQIRQVEYGIEQDTLLNETNLTLINGITYVVGNNGSGKSTLLKLVATVLSPKKGTVRFTRLEKNNEQAMYRRSLEVQEVRSLIGYMPQDFSGFPKMRVRQYLKYVAYHKGIPRIYWKAHLPQYLELTGLDVLANNRLETLSRGQLQKVGLLQALFHHPPICILDEPFEGLDVIDRIFFKNWLQRLSSHSVIVISTNRLSDFEPSEIDELLLLKDGRLQELNNSRERNLIESLFI